MRNPMEVVNEMAKIDGLPVDIKERLDWYSGDFSYKAPEQASSCFLRLSRYCNEVLPFPPKDSWQIEMVSLLMDKSVAETKEWLSE